jgi:hypothetical protein
MMQGPLQMTAARALVLARGAYSSSTGYFDANVRRRVEQDIRLFQSKHSPGSKYLSEAYRRRSTLFRPKTRAAVRQNEANAAEAFFSTLDTVVVSAEDEQNPVQRASAEVMKALLNYRLQKSIPWFLLSMGAFQDAQVTGVVISHQDWEFDPAKGIDRPLIELVPVENFRFSENASWLDPVGTSPFLIQLIPMHLKDVKKRTRSGPDGEDPAWIPVPEEKLLAEAIRYDSTRSLRDDGASETGSASEVNEFSLVWVRRVIVEENGIDWLYYTLGDSTLLSLPVPLKAKYAHGRRPYVVGRTVIETHRAYPCSDVDITKAVQQEINEIANQRLDNVRLVMNKRYFVQRNKQVDLRALTRNTPGGAVLMNDTEKDVRVVDTPDVTSSSYQEQDRLNLDFDEVSGTFSTSSVQSNRRLNETVGGLGLLSDSSNKVANYRLKIFVETWMEPVLRQITLLLQEYETNEKLLQLAGAAANLMQRFGIDLPTDEILRAELTLTVDVGMGTVSPTNRVNNLMLGVRGVKESLDDGVLERHGVKPLEIIKEIFGALGHRNGGKFIAPEGAEDPQVENLRRQVADLQQQIEAKQPQAIVDATVSKILAEIELIKEEVELTKAKKVQLGVTSAYSAIQTGEVVAAVPAVAPIADKVLEAAGYTEPNPPGIDPNLPMSPEEAGAPAGLVPAAQEAIETGPIDIPGSGNTSPMFPATPGGGAAQGIETQEADGVPSDGGVAP